MEKSTVGVFAEVDIPIGTKSAIFSLNSFNAQKNILKTLDSSLSPKVTLSKSFEIILVQSEGSESINTSSHNWIKLIKIAPDCTVQNVTLIKCPNSHLVYLETCKSIFANNELFLWFDPSILIQSLGISPYLSPFNIKSKNYSCHNCGREFKDPNPLKLHIALSCGEVGKNSIWEKLESSFGNSWSGNCSGIQISNLDSVHQAQLESIMSNMGKGKNGHHVCLYCGKLYSRKYGLKIHIRTHTGFKPLKCKICFRPFGDPSNLNKHVRLHSDGNTPYRCDTCGKILVRRRDLDRHIRSRHTNVSPIELSGHLNSNTTISSPSPSQLISFNNINSRVLSKF